MEIARSLNEDQPPPYRVPMRYPNDVSVSNIWLQYLNSASYQENNQYNGRIRTLGNHHPQKNYNVHGFRKSFSGKHPIPGKYYKKYLP